MLQCPPWAHHSRSTFLALCIQGLAGAGGPGLPSSSPWASESKLQGAGFVLTAAVGPTHEPCWAGSAQFSPFWESFPSAPGLSEGGGRADGHSSHAIPQPPLPILRAACHLPPIPASLGLRLVPVLQLPEAEGMVRDSRCRGREGNPGHTKKSGQGCWARPSGGCCACYAVVQHPAGPAEVPQQAVALGELGVGLGPHCGV